MPRQAKAARLWLRPAGKAGASVWVIRDGGFYQSTGCGPDAYGEAEKRLQEYLASKHEPAKRGRRLDEIPVADVISIYLDEIAPSQARPEKAVERAGRLLEFFKASSLADITKRKCQEYAAWRGSPGGARRDLQDLSAAIGNAHEHGLFRETFKLWLPPSGKARVRFLERDEAAALLWKCWRTRETQGAWATQRRPLRHLVRVILIGLYTGSRPGAICGLSWDRTTHRGWVDLDRGLIYRLAQDARETTKRQPPIPMSPRLMAHMRRWARLDGHAGPVIRFNGKSVLQIDKAFKRAVDLCGLGDVIPYTLRHTAASWLVQKGVSTFKVAELLGTSEAMIRKHYGHLSPDHLRAEVAMLGRK